MVSGARQVRPKYAALGQREWCALWLSWKVRTQPQDIQMGIVFFKASGAKPNMSAGLIRLTPHWLVTLRLSWNRWGRGNEDMPRMALESLFTSTSDH